MLFRNELVFGGEVVRKTDFGVDNGGNIIVKGASRFGDVEMSFLLTDDMFLDICDKSYAKVIVTAHVEQRIHETANHRIKKSHRFIADKLELVS